MLLSVVNTEKKKKCSFVLIFLIFKCHAEEITARTGSNISKKEAKSWKRSSASASKLKETNMQAINYLVIIAALTLVHVVVPTAQAAIEVT